MCKLVDELMDRVIHVLQGYSELGYICLMISFLAKHFFPSFIILFLLFSCTQNPVPPASVESSNSKNTLVGTWLTDEILIGIDTIHNSRTSVLLEIKKEEWREKLKLLPIQTIFNQNKTYVSAYSTIEGKIIR